MPKPKHKPWTFLLFIIRKKAWAFEGLENYRVSHQSTRLWKAIISLKGVKTYEKNKRGEARSEKREKIEEMDSSDDEETKKKRKLQRTERKEEMQRIE